MLKKSREYVEVLYREYGPSVRRFLYRKIQSREDAEDILHETFVRLQNIKEIEAIEYPRAFIFTIANNLATDNIRRKTIRGVKNASYAEEQIEQKNSTGLNPEESYLRKQYLQMLSEVIIDLPPKCRQAFILRKFHNLSYKEIALEMSISVKTVEKHLAKALCTCKTNLMIKNDNVIKFDVAIEYTVSQQCVRADKNV
ncbi:RNA polymerase sigma factor [Paremcibacter congregatus]|uniref:RNA polymerase subunit sigma-24 n=1 Tax=Paremcibacter congregatus TaxID=2043170 RepID=A0A2G4YQ17_9PROT|nr:RNA polymerase sigma factor [Paremcibacter congregatus]PHZ84421.1 RNA polymerase subunit sigma-24 [Paremcibacter congregatus]QDE28639.1 RNA polymerase sigma factor [Paremcibacter congregatus]